MSTGDVTTTYASATQAYTKESLDDLLNPRVAKNMMRECCDSEEHPDSVPIILALDVTGSMGQAAIEVSKKLNTIVKGIADKISDAEFMIMGIGDIDYDQSPIQYSQFESDIRIAQNLDSIYFEMGGGPNAYESYTAAWYIGARRTRCDCWERGKKGLILTMGDEILNPHLQPGAMNRAIGETTIQAPIGTQELFREVSEKYDIGHIVVDHCYGRDGYYEKCRKSFADVIGGQMVAITNVLDISSTIVKFVETWYAGRKAEMPNVSLKVEQPDDGTMSVISWA